MFAHILLCVSTASLPVVISEIRQEQLFGGWQKAQDEIRSLIVEFSYEAPILESKPLKGVFKLRRAPNGAILARCELGAGPERRCALLVADRAYLMEPAEKTALRFNLPRHGILKVLSAYYNPFMVLLDKRYVQEHFRLQVTNQDEWYTYLSLAPRDAKERRRFLGIMSFDGIVSWSHEDFSSGTIAVLNKDSDSIPKDMPRALTWTDGLNSYRYDIHKWQRNGANAPPLSDFQAPEEMPGWRVVDMGSQ
jgi:hypothetical protein